MRPFTVIWHGANGANHCVEIQATDECDAVARLLRTIPYAQAAWIA